MPNPQRKKQAIAVARQSTAMRIRIGHRSDRYPMMALPGTEAADHQQARMERDRSTDHS